MSKPGKHILLYGKNSIRERIVQQPQTIRQIFVQDNFRDQEFLDCLKDSGLPFSFRDAKTMERTKRADRLQGLIAEVDPFVYTDIYDLLGESNDNKRTLIFLDGLNDPHNLGSILRITACFGGFALCLPKHQSCDVNETVLHVASGGENYVPVAMISNIANTITKAKEAGYWIAGTHVEQGKVLGQMDLPFPLGIVLGSEGKGMSPGLQKHVDFNLTIPMAGAALSFNVAMACSIFCYEISQKR